MIGRAAHFREYGGDAVHEPAQAGKMAVGLLRQHPVEWQEHLLPGGEQRLYLLPPPPQPGRRDPAEAWWEFPAFPAADFEMPGR